MRPVLAGDTATEKLNTIRKALGEVRIREDQSDEGEDDDILMPLDVDDKKDRWDCETILSAHISASLFVLEFIASNLSQLHTVIWKIILDSFVRGEGIEYPRFASIPRQAFLSSRITLSSRFLRTRKMMHPCVSSISV